MAEPMFGDLVLVRPRKGLRVQEHANIAGRIMPDAWQERLWDDWLHRRYMTGEIEIMERPEEPAPLPKLSAKDKG